MRIASGNTPPNSGVGAVAIKLSNTPAYPDAVVSIAIGTHVRPRATLGLTVDKEPLSSDGLIADITTLGWIELEGCIPSGHI